MSNLYEQLKTVKTPCYVVDEGLLEDNLKILSKVKERAGCKILLAQKAFSMYAVYPLLSRYLDGTTASGLYEAKLGREEFPGEVHVYSSAYREDEFDEILEISDHIVFNSLSQYERFRDKTLAIRNKNATPKSFGLRINPECSTQEHEIYDPCAAGSRLGTTRDKLNKDLIIKEFDGIHFHTLCEQNSDALVKTIAAIEEKFGDILSEMKWVNFGGGHHITRADYDIDQLVDCIKKFKSKYNVEVYLEPGEAIALNTGFLVTEVLDIVENGISIALLDASAACHMPDVIEMPYRPPLHESGMPQQKPYTYRLAGATCLAGDIIGDYSFNRQLEVGDKLIFEDMAIYTMVKNNTFNGMKLPSIAIRRKNGDIETIKEFGYNDFKHRLS